MKMSISKKKDAYLEKKAPFLSTFFSIVVEKYTFEKELLK